MNKYPHLSNVLNQKFDNVSKFEIEGLESKQAQGLEAVVEQLKKLIELQAKEIKVKEAEREKLKEKLTEEEDKKEAREAEGGTGLTPTELKEAQEKSKRNIQAYKDNMKRLREKRNTPKEPTPKQQIFDNPVSQKVGKPSSSQIRREIGERTARIKRKKQRESKTNKEVSNLIDRMSQNEETSNVNSNAGSNLSNLINTDKANREKKFNKSEDDESNWFSSVRV